MDDMNAFEHQVRREVVLAMGPFRPVDDSAIFTVITATRSPKWTITPTFRTSRFVLAAGIVALFGGLLLAGLLTQPSDDMAPAAVTASPSPTTTEALLSGMDTEEVEPGVFRVLSDGVRESLALDSQANVVAGMDRSVVLWDTDRICHPPYAFKLSASCAAYRLGDPETFSLSETGEQVRDPGRDLTPVGYGLHEVGPDGTIWGYSFIQGAGKKDLRAWDGDSLVVRKERGTIPRRSSLASLLMGPPGPSGATVAMRTPA